MKPYITLFMATVIFLLDGCGSNNIGNSSTPSNINEVDLKNTSFPYQSNSPYSATLLKCIDPLTIADSCSLNTLPLIAQESDVVTKSLIMERVVVSDRWMGERFSQLLDLLDGKAIKRLFGATTAIVIHRELIPSFYTPVTGAIYLDPRYLWLTPAEASTIVKKEDFRSDFGNELLFITGSINTLNGERIDTFKALDSGLSRTFDEILSPFAALLYHELAHANDFIQPSIIRNLDRNQSVFKSTELLANNRISVLLKNEFPLTSSKLASLGTVLYTGHTASSEEKELTGFVAGELFDEDRASDIYAYSSIYEDVATLFADTMMKLHFNVDNNVLFLDTDTRKLQWGINNPIAKDSVRPRALFVSNRLSPITNGWNSKFDTRVGIYKYLHTDRSRKILKQINIDFKYKNPFKDHHI